MRSAAGAPGPLLNQDGSVQQHSETSQPASADQPDRPLAAIIMAAGKGTRMKSDRPKVVHEVAGRPMVSWVVDAVREVDAVPIILVIGHGADEVRDVCEGNDDDIRYAVQHEQLGTGDAARCAVEALEGFGGDVFVLAGDGPLIRPQTLRAMRERHLRTRAAATLATAVLDDPTGYGRVIRDESGRFDRIVEQKNADDEQRAVREVFPSYACFDTTLLLGALRDLRADEVTGEYYVTDIPAMLKAAGYRVELVDAVPPEDVLSINTPEQLSEVDSILNTRLEMTR